MRLSTPSRTMQDTRASRSVPGPARLTSAQQAYAELTRLAREKSRLLEERELWQRKLRRIGMRLAEIESQMSRLGGRLPEPAPGSSARPNGQAWQEIEIRY